ncbi:DUF3987 domain-containing protein [Nonomuraea dietziae]|uniref:DUF3987 domain-containing protein n=1 Tax=Nonomuraea dietziae TaxID=65515 RepID=UPI0033C2B97B
MTTITDPHADADALLSQLGAAEQLAELHQAAQPWDKPAPFGRRRELPPFPVHALPPWVADHMSAVAEETQTPLDLAGCVGLAALSTAAGGRAVVNVRGSWTEPVNLFVLVAMPPGSRKSAVFRAMTAPLHSAEKALADRVGPQITEAEVSRRSPSTWPRRQPVRQAAREGRPHPRPSPRRRAPPCLWRASRSLSCPGS